MEALKGRVFHYVKPDQKQFFLLDTIRYLRSEKQRYSLTGKIGTAGISKSCERAYSESNGLSDKVQVTMPAVGDYPSKVWENLHEDSTPLVLSWCHLDVEEYKGELHQQIKTAYQKSGIADKCLYFSSLLAGHEYDVYHLNEIMRFFDKYCKDSEL